MRRFARHDKQPHRRADDDLGAHDEGGRDCWFMVLPNRWALRLRLGKQMLRLRLARQPTLRCQLVKQQAKSAHLSFAVTKLVMIVSSQGRVKSAVPAGSSSVHDGKRCWLCSGGRKEPIARTSAQKMFLPATW